MRKSHLKIYSSFLFACCLAFASFKSNAIEGYFQCAGGYNGSTPGQAAEALCSSGLASYCGGFSFISNFATVQLFDKSGSPWVIKNCQFKSGCIDGYCATFATQDEMVFCPDGYPTDATDPLGMVGCDRPTPKACSDGTFVLSGDICTEPLPVCADHDSCLAHSLENIPCADGDFLFNFTDSANFSFSCTTVIDDPDNYGCNNIDCGTYSYVPPENPTDPDPTDPDPTDPDPTDPDPIDPNPIDPNPIDPNPTDPNPTDPDPTSPSYPQPIDYSSDFDAIASVGQQSVNELKSLNSKMDSLTTSTIDINDSPSEGLKGFYAPVYPNGFSDVWSNVESSLAGSGAMSYVNSWKVTIEGQAPEFGFCIDLMGIYKCINFDLPAWIWTFLRAVMLFSTAMFCRWLILGG